MIEAYSVSDPGRKRLNNEDCVAVDPDVGLAVVADGMGGHQSGEIASRLAVETLRTFVRNAQLDQDLTWPFGVDVERSFAVNSLATAIKLANRRVFDESAAHESLTGMGTTVVAVLVHEGRVTYAGVGDSRVYLLCGQTFRQLTRDDSWIEAAVAQQLVGPGERHHHPLRHVLTKALGLAEDVDFVVGEEALQPGDLVLLCSDGLTSVLSNEEIGAILRTHAGDLREACAALVARANAGGGPDNVTVVVVRERDTGGRADRRGGGRP
jgi:PPM family protein phosphatase